MTQDIETHLRDLLAEMAQLPEFVGRPLNNPNDCGNYGNTPLHIAAIRGDTRAARVLLAAGADPNARGEEGYTPLHDAVEQEHLEFIRLLLRNGASTEQQNADGETALELAQLSDNPEVLRLLAGNDRRA